MAVEGQGLSDAGSGIPNTEVSSSETILTDKFHDRRGSFGPLLLGDDNITDDSLLQRVKRDFLDPTTNVENLIQLSRALADSFKNACSQTGPTMLPSFIGDDHGRREDRTFLALDVGGSTMRAAFVRVYGDQDDGRPAPPRLTGLRTWPIDGDVRGLSGTMFFRWIAARVRSILTNIEPYECNWQSGASIATGLTWSFPFRQVLLNDGYILETGKGFTCLDGLVGQKLNGLLEGAFTAEGVNIRLDAIVNDSVSSFLAHSHVASSTQTSIILGTGCNAAFRLPVSVLSSKDLINHPQGWTEATRSVIVNSELSLFGENIVQNSEWDEILQGQIRSPCRQPLEYVCGGLYLGEIMRLITIDAIHQKRLFNGQMPLGLQDRFSFSLPLAAVLEEDTSPDLSGAGLEFSTQFPLPGDRYPSPSDLKYIREIVRATSRRAAAYIAVSVHAMHSFLRTSTSESDLPFQPLPLAVGITGSVITKYPNFARNCRRYLLEIVTATEANQDVSIFFNETKCPTVIGAALAACFARQ